MGLFKGAAKAGLAAKALQIVKREAAKPQNQQKAKELLAKIGNSRKPGPKR